MIFLTGPRQVGKTTLVKSLLTERLAVYYNWDSLEDRKVIVLGYEAITKALNLDVLVAKKPVVIFDEIHKMAGWKNFLKGFYDTYKSQLQIIVTGSARLDVYQKGGDSLMGRYFLYHQYPFDVSECLRVEFPRTEIVSPQEIDDVTWTNLFNFGGFPEPFIRHDKMFLNQWQSLKHNQLFREDLRDLSKIRDVAQCELLASMLQHQATQLVNYSRLASHIRVSDYSVRTWMDTLRSLYYCFFVHPWSKNIPRSLLKEPKCYLWDWSLIADYGARVENFVACHLCKAVNLWRDIGLGNYGLHFLRDKDKNEVDFLVTKNDQPWIMVEVKSSCKASINQALYKFKERLGVEHVLQVAYDMPFINQDCFALDKPMIVPMKTFLSQMA
ncbi:MAG: ATP-binding protein [Gammaproteobacteria bacterium]|nr:ATP-binding protein [Gammaproteobacteria bacterium]